MVQKPQKKRDRDDHEELESYTGEDDLSYEAFKKHKKNARSC